LPSPFDAIICVMCITRFHVVLMAQLRNLKLGQKVNTSVHVLNQLPLTLPIDWSRA